ncbi:MAG: sigma-70 family RNA polymerase sigma factor [Acidobacteriota bacterium]
METLSDPARRLRRQFDEMAVTHREPLWRFCLKLTGSPWEAEDLVQETLLRAFARLSLSWQPIEPRAYLFRTASNVWIDQWRRQGRWVALDELPREPAAPDAIDPLEAADAMAAVVECLSAPQRVVFLLTEAFGFAHAEVAAMLGISAGAVKALRYRARVSLSAVGRDGSAGGAAANAGPRSPLLDRYVEAFNRRDVEGIVALLDPDAVNDIVGVAEERGAEIQRRNSLAEWAADPRPTRAEVREVFGRHLVLVFETPDEGADALSWFVDASTAGGRIVSQRLYCYCPELLRMVGAEIGCPVRTRGYWYEPSPA